MSIQKIEYKARITKNFAGDVLIHVPNTDRKKLSLVLDLHGAGERGGSLDGFDGGFIINNIDSTVGNDAIVVAPRCEDGNIWSVDRLKATVNYCVDSYHVDTNKIHVIGYSMGARGAWDLICEYPDTFASAVMLSGFACYLRAPKVNHMSIWAFHGLIDDVVPVIEAAKMVDAIKASSFNNHDVKFDIINSGRHDIFDMVYRHAPLYKWILSKDLKDNVQRQISINLAGNKWLKEQEERRKQRPN